MRKIFFMTLFILVMAAGMGADGVFAGDAPADFSADIINTSAEGVMRMKLYASGKKSRMEMPGNIMIMRQDLQVMWLVMPEQGIYMEHPIDQEMLAKTATAAISGELSRESMGTEVVDGKNARRFKVDYLAQGVGGSVYQWIDEKEIPVRTQAIDGSWTVEYKNVVLASQPASLFEPPAGSQKMALASMTDLIKSMPVED